MVTASDLYDYCKCPHRVYLTYHGDPAEKLPISPFLNLLFERGVKHEETIISGLKFERPAGTTAAERFKASLELMRRGSDLIYHGVLIDRDLVGIPDLLEKQPGPSSLGEYYYRAIDIKSGRGYDKRSHKLREHYGLQLFHYANLLETVQRHFPPICQIWNIHGERVDYPLSEFRAVYEDVLPTISRLVSGDETDEPALCGDCPLCQWQEHCLTWLEKEEDITLVAGIGRSYKEKLAPLGLTKISSTAGWDPALVVSVKGIGEKRAATWQRQARVQQSGDIEKLEKPELKDAPIKIYFDFEDDPTQDIVYLYGLLIEEPDGNLDYKYFLAEGIEHEETKWQEFIVFCKRLAGKDFVVYHYHHHEEVVLNRLAEKYPDFDEGALRVFMDNFVDLHKVLTKAVVLPTKGYGLKPVSLYLGFKYTSKDAGGAQSIFWFNEFQKNPGSNRESLDRVLEYNREDCEATKLVKDWLSRM